MPCVGIEGCQHALADSLPSAPHLARAPAAGSMCRARVHSRALQSGHRATHLQTDMHEGPVSGHLRTGQQHDAYR